MFRKSEAKVLVAASLTAPWLGCLAVPAILIFDAASDPLMSMPAMAQIALLIYLATASVSCALCLFPFGPIYIAARVGNFSGPVFAILLGALASMGVFTLLGSHPSIVLPWVVAGATTGWFFHTLTERWLNHAGKT